MEVARRRATPPPIENPIALEMKLDEEALRNLAWETALRQHNFKRIGAALRGEYLPPLENTSPPSSSPAPSSPSAAPGPLTATYGRILTSEEAARYVGYSGFTSRFDQWMKEHLGVRPIAGRRGRYDRKAIDDALNALACANDAHRSLPEADVNAIDLHMRERHRDKT